MKQEPETTREDRAREFCFYSKLPLGYPNHKAVHKLMAEFATTEAEVASSAAVAERDAAILIASDAIGLLNAPDDAPESYKSGLISIKRHLNERLDELRGGSRDE